MRVLVTGGSGFIGTNLVQTLATNHEVLNFDPQRPRDSRQTRNWRAVDIQDADVLNREVGRFQPDRVIHLGARTDLKGGSVQDYAQNVSGVQNVINAVAQLDRDVHTVYASSRLVFEIGHKPVNDWDYKPSTAYGQSKILGEKIVRETAGRAGSWTIVRPTSIWGPWFETPYRDFFDMVANGRYVKFSGRDPLKSFGYVGNAVYQLERLALGAVEPVNEKVFWLSDYEPLRLSDWADKVADALGRSRPRYAPWPLARLAAGAGDLITRVGGRFPLTSFRLNNLVTDMVYDVQTTRDVVGELPYNLDTAVGHTVNWYVQNRPS